MAFEKLSDSVHELNHNIRAFIESNVEYYKLKAFKSGMKGAISLVRFLILISLFSVAGVLLSFGLAILISQATGVPSLGYFIVGAFYIILAILLFTVGKKPIEKFMLKKFSKVVFEENEDS